MVDRSRLGFQSGSGTALQFCYDSTDALCMILDPRAQPAPNVSATRHGGEIVKLIEQPATRQALQNSEPKSRTANAAAGNAERGSLFFQAMNRGQNCFQPDLGFGRTRIIGRQFAMQRSELSFEHFVQ